MQEVLHFKIHLKAF